ncbi:lysophospholipid acyltransferase 1-like [Amphiura filiformis]|uniref:lysophospholipid acyltransferase 1-like n=1 Tax=Amphiura filiformis TaxID=82378 RepID=UPI003B2215C4
MVHFQVIQNLSDKLGVRYVELNFVICQCLALLCSYIFRWFFKPTKVSATTRHAVQLVVGFLLAILAFNMGLFHVLIDATVCYIMMLTIDPHLAQYYVFAFSMSYMSAVHIYHQSLELGVYNLDYIGPLMILTMKLSSLSWSIHDGCARDEDKLTDQQKKMIVRKVPNPLEFYSFIFNVPGLLVGPVCYFTHYTEFIDGTNFMHSVKNEKGEEVMVYKEPSSVRAVTGKLLFTVMSALVLMLVVPRFPIWGNVDDDFINNGSFLYKIGFLMVSIEVAKSKYFFAWVWADAINNAAGIGFNGYDKHGKPKWDGVTNIRIWNFETATSLKVLVDNWNVTGSTWLRHVCYDRVPFQKQLITFVLSAVWHGFYMGYFITFLSASLFVTAAKKVRINLRHHFQSSVGLSRFYDVLTWACTHLCLAYFIAPFTFLRWDPCIKYFNSLYWFLHILAIAALFLPGRRRTKPPSEETSKRPEVLNHNLPPHISESFNGSLQFEDKKER